MTTDIKHNPTPQGWDENSWGYHGDDGHSFTGSGTGKDYGPCYTTGDVVGCGVDFSEGVAFYTKNGSPLGVAFRDIPVSSELYPCVGMRTPGEHITVNFGQEPFLFDITQYIKVRYTPTLSHVSKNDTILIAHFYRTEKQNYGMQ